MDIAKTRAIRAEIRASIPAYRTGIVDDDSLSAALATLSELLVFRVLNSRGQTTDSESIALVAEASEGVSEAMAVFLAKYLPGSKITKLFRHPGDGLSGPKGS